VPIDRLQGSDAGELDRAAMFGCIRQKVGSRQTRRPAAWVGAPRNRQDPVLTARVPQALIDHLEEWAKASGVTRSQAVRLFIENGLLKKPHRLVEMGLKVKK
jgi:hypothetical protein